MKSRKVLIWQFHRESTCTCVYMGRMSSQQHKRNLHGSNSPLSNEQLTLAMDLLASQLKFRLSSSPLPVQDTMSSMVGAEGLIVCICRMVYGYTILLKAINFSETFYLTHP